MEAANYSETSACTKRGVKNTNDAYHLKINLYLMRETSIFRHDFFWKNLRLWALSKIKEYLDDITSFLILI